MLNIAKELQQRKENGLYRKRRIIESVQGPLITIEGKQYINFSSNDYLGLANNEELKDGMIEAINKYGLGAASSSLLVGYSDAHKRLEKKLSRFLARDASLVFPSGYQANLAIASALIDSNTVVLQDKLNHASLIDSAILSKGKLFRYRHNDMQHLETLLEKHKEKKLLIMTDGVFSMDGDYAKLLEIVELSKAYNAMLVVDDAHGLGVLGETGAGLLEQLRLNQEHVPVLIGTFGKAFAANGAFVAGDELLIETFIQKARTYIYTTALLPALAVTISLAIDLIMNGGQLRNNVKDLIAYYKKNIKQTHYESDVSQSHIQPIIVGDIEETNRLSASLHEKNIIAAAIRPPTVPQGSSRLRISLSAAHTKDQLDNLFHALREAA